MKLATFTLILFYYSAVQSTVGRGLYESKIYTPQPLFGRSS